MTATRSGALSVHVPASEPCDFFDGDLHDMFALFDGPEQLGLAPPRSPTDSSDSRGKDGPLNGTSNSGTSSSAVVPSYGGHYPNTYEMAGRPIIMVPQQHLAPQGSYGLAQCDEGLMGGLESSGVCASGARGEGKLHISHSTIEKQRRYRINSLIDQLRDLVPSQGALRGPDGSEMKRPKHVVLSDTIRLLRRMQEQAAQDQHEMQRLRSSLATASSGTPGVDATAAAAQPILELPVLLSNAPAAVGVIVEEGPQSFQVKVNCKDRHGLLSDITQALKELPLEITRAAITTSSGGSVYDVFEIQYEPGSGITAMDVQYQLHSVLYAHRMREQEAGLKRTRCEQP